MLNTIKEALLYVVEFFKQIYTYVVSLITDIVQFGSDLLESYEAAMDFVNLILPPIVVPFVTACIGVVVILRIIGRS